MKKTIFLTFLFLISGFYMQSQDKYEYAIIEYSTLEGKISISKDGIEFGRENVSPTVSPFNANPFLAKVKEFQDKDWEIMSFETLFVGKQVERKVYMAYLKRKKIK